MRKTIFLCVLFTCVFALNISSVGAKQGKQSQMSNTRLAALIKKIDKNMKGRPGLWQFVIDEVPVLVVTDERANRMRIITPVVDVDKVDSGKMKRLLQANFDSALDARYAVAKGKLWSAFIHPLSSLQDKEFLEAVGQVVNLRHTYGKSYSSGALIYRGGDSEGLQQRRKLIDKLLEKGLSA